MNASSMNGTKPARRWEFLDAVRGISALAVLVEHWMEDCKVPHITGLLRVFSPGGMGVAAFFLVSGFIIPVSLEKYGSLRIFWIGRAFRLLPLYLFSISLTFVLRDDPTFTPPLLSTAPAWRLLLGNGFMSQELFHVPYPIGIYWTLSTEMMFYCCCSLLFTLGVLRRSVLWSLAASIAYASVALFVGFVLHHALSAEKMGGVVAAFLGTVLYRYCFQNEERRWVGVAVITFWLAIIAGFWCRFVGFARHGEFRYLGFRSITLGWTAALVLFLGLLALRRRECPRTLLWFGKISYSLYLMHPFVFALFRKHMSTPWGFLGVLACSVAFASLTYTFIETPFLTLQHRLFPRRPSEPPPATSMTAL